MTQTVTGVTVGNIAVFANKNGDVKDINLNGSNGLGTVTSVSVATANGVSGTVATPTTTPAITVSLGAITPTSVAASGAVTGSNLSGTNTGDSTAPAQPITGYVSGSGTVAGTDTILQAIQKLNGNTALLTGAVVFQGTWNANTNSPALASGVGTKGSLYKVSVAGATALDGISSWNAGDSVVFDGTTWDKIDGLANEVLSVAGRTGAVTLAFTDVSGVATAAQIPAPTASTIGGVQSYAAVSHQFLTSVSTAGAHASAQPADSDIAFTDITTGNVSTTAHGFAPKAPNDATKFLDGTGAFSVPAAPATVPSANITGVTDASDAAAGRVGEFISSTIVSGSAVSMVNNTSKTITSISLTAGDWDVTGMITLNIGGGTTVTAVAGTIGLTNNTIVSEIAASITNGNTTGSGAQKAGGIVNAGNAFSGGDALGMPRLRVHITSTLTIYLCANAAFTGGTLGIYGFISARRVH